MQVHPALSFLTVIRSSIMTTSTVKIILLGLFLSFLVTPLAGVDVYGGQATVTLVLDEDDVGPLEIISHVYITASDEVKAMGYMVNLQKNISSLAISGKENTHISIILLESLEEGETLNTTLTYVNNADVLITRNWSRHPFELQIDKHGRPTNFNFTLSISEENANVPPAEEPEVTPDPEKPDIPTLPDLPELPDTPSDPENPDTPGSDEPYVPILPPAGNVYNIAGVIPLFAGFFLLFLLFFWRRKVYRILKKHAKEHGEKPERKQLKATADTIIQLIRDEEKYPKWRKNSELTKRLETDIIRTLDEMQYPPTIPRDPVVADIIKAAKGRINRHRL